MLWVKSASSLLKRVPLKVPLCCAKFAQLTGYQLLLAPQHVLYDVFHNRRALATPFDAVTAHKRSVCRRFVMTSHTQTWPFGRCVASHKPALTLNVSFGRTCPHVHRCAESVTRLRLCVCRSVLKLNAANVRVKNVCIICGG